MYADAVAAGGENMHSLRGRLSPVHRGHQLVKAGRGTIVLIKETQQRLH